jgi:hypothetical protein
MDLAGPQIGNIQKIEQPDFIDPSVVKRISGFWQRRRCAARHRWKFECERTRRNCGVHAAAGGAGDDADRQIVRGCPRIVPILGRTPRVERLDQEIESAGGITPG